jgi:hypothetical protein
VSPWLDGPLISIASEREFRRRMRVSKNTFIFICAILRSELKRDSRGVGLPLETIVGVSLNRLGSRKYLFSCVDQFDISESTTCIAVRQFCQAVLKVLWKQVVPKIDLVGQKKVAAEFEAKHEIPFIMGAIDGSHFLIVAPSPDPTPFYNRKGFHSVLLQGIIDMQTVFWDWDFGWAGSLHDYTIFLPPMKAFNTWKVTIYLTSLLEMLHIFVEEPYMFHLKE